MVVGSPHAVFFDVGKLGFDHVGPVSHLVQGRACQAPEPVPGHAALVPHALKGFQHGVVAHGR